jgi:light-regulated signal transduction histidine kinase (bacteriophytochrome)
MDELTSDLLRLSRANRAEIRRGSVDLSMLARGIIQDLRETHPERKVTVRIMDGIKVQADMALLRIALENLLSNAWKFTSKTAEAEIEVGMECDRTYYVRDNGAGFDMAQASRLFGTFQRLHADSDFPGTGIGLTTVERIVRRHGGQIRADGAVGRGATFYFDLGTADQNAGSNGALEEAE